MTKFYEIATVNGSEVINLSMITTISEVTDDCSEPMSQLRLVDGSHFLVKKHSLMLALHHSETPYMLMGPGEETPPELLSDVSDDDIKDVSETIEGQV